MSSIPNPFSLLSPDSLLKGIYINRGMDDTMGGACSTQRHDRGNSSSRNDRNRCVSFSYDVDTVFDCIHACILVGLPVSFFVD